MKNSQYNNWFTKLSQQEKLPDAKLPIDESLVAQVQQKGRGSSIHAVNQLIHHMYIWSRMGKQDLLDLAERCLRIFLATGDIKSARNIYDEEYKKLPDPWTK